MASKYAAVKKVTVVELTKLLPDLRLCTQVIGWGLRSKTLIPRRMHWYDTDQRERERERERDMMNETLISGSMYRCYTDLRRRVNKCDSDSRQWAQMLHWS